MYGLRITTRISDKNALHKMLRSERDTYARTHWYNLLSQNFKELCNKGVSQSARMMMEKKFSVDITAQLIIEQYLDSLTTIQPLSHPVILDLAGPSRCAHYENNTYRDV